MYQSIRLRVVHLCLRTTLWGGWGYPTQMAWCLSTCWSIATCVEQTWNSHKHNQQKMIVKILERQSSWDGVQVRNLSQREDGDLRTLTTRQHQHEAAYKHRANKVQQLQWVYVSYSRVSTASQQVLSQSCHVYCSIYRRHSDKRIAKPLC